MPTVEKVKITLPEPPLLNITIFRFKSFQNTQEKVLSSEI